MDPALPLLVAALGLLGAAALAVTAATYAGAARTLAARPPHDPDERRPLPPISVLKPLKGADDGLFENLAALARQDYPVFELVCGAADPDDPALAVARRVAADFPGADVRIVAGVPPLGLNPKVGLLAGLARRARHEHLLISDADVRPGPGYLRALGAAAAGDSTHPPAALVSSVLTGANLAADRRPAAGALCDELHLGTFVAAGVAAASAAGRPCVVGKSMLFSSRDLAALGGWRTVADVLAEDYVLGCAFAAARRRVALSNHVLPVASGRHRLRDFTARHLRWCQMRWRLAPLAYLGEALLNPVPALVATAVTAAGLSLHGDGAGWAVAAAAATAGIALKAAADGWLLGRLAGRRIPSARLAWIPLKDLLIAAVWALAPWKRTVAWRGSRLRIGAGSRLSVPVSTRPAAAPPRLAREVP